MRSFFIYNGVQNQLGLHLSFLNKNILYQQYGYNVKGILSDDIEDNDTRKNQLGFTMTGPEVLTLTPH